MGNGVSDDRTPLFLIRMINMDVKRLEVFLKLYRVTHLVANLGWVDLDLGSSLAGGRYCTYLLPKQDGGTSQI